MLWTALLLFSLYRLLLFLLRDKPTALLSVALVAVDYQIMVAGSFGRYDPTVAALGFGGYVLYLTLRERNLTLALLLANTSVMLCGTTHPNGLPCFMGLWVRALYLDRRRIGVRQLALCAIPYLAGAAVWATYLMQDPASALAQLRNNSYSRVAIFEPLQALKREILVALRPGIRIDRSAFRWVRQTRSTESGPSAGLPGGCHRLLFDK
jgi:hypothetical protein